MRRRLAHAGRSVRGSRLSALAAGLMLLTALVGCDRRGIEVVESRKSSQNVEAMEEGVRERANQGG